MARRAKAKDLLFISKTVKEKMRAFKAGVNLERRTGYTIDELREKACTDRLRFASHFLAAAKQAARHKSIPHRTAISRRYYAMYHAARAIVYFMHEGDDHESHSELPAHLPGDFPQRANWENELKSARLERNRADYDAYPRADRAFESVAADLESKAKEFLELVRKYLKQKGCKI